MGFRLRAPCFAAAVLALAACSSFAASSADSPDAGVAEGGLPDVTRPDASVDDGATPERYPAAVLADGPIAYWRMGITSGSTIPNEVDPSNPLTLQKNVQLGRPGALQGDSNTAIAFDGLNEGYAVATDPRPFDFPNAAKFTIEWWANHVRVDGGSTFQHMIGAAQGSTPQTGNGYFAYWNADAKVQVEFAQPNAVTTLTSTTALGWKYYALVFDGTNVALFVDGAQEASKIASGKLAARASAFVVGATSGSTPGGIGGYGFSGSMDEVAIYDKALSLPQIVAHYDAAR